VTPTWFLYLGGFSLFILGVLQIYVRPREKGDGIYKRFVNVGTLWSLICISFGTLLVVMALGYWDNPLGAQQPPPIKSPRHHRGR
jgi:hypothetical protein